MVGMEFNLRDRMTPKINDSPVFIRYILSYKNMSEETRRGFGAIDGIKTTKSGYV